MTEIAKEYGTALFMLASEVGSRDEYAEALNTLKNLFSESTEYTEFLTSPAIPLGERLDAIEKAFFGAFPEHIVSYLQLLCEKGRFSCFRDSVDEFNSLLNASKHISKATVKSAVELTEAEKNRLNDKLEKLCGGQVDMEYIIDSSLLGGLIVEVDGKIMDGSLRHKLGEMKEVMNK